MGTKGRVQLYWRRLCWIKNSTRLCFIEIIDDNFRGWDNRRHSRVDIHHNSTLSIIEVLEATVIGAAERVLIHNITELQPKYYDYPSPCDAGASEVRYKRAESPSLMMAS